jgi:hypothetical protein
MRKYLIGALGAAALAIGAFAPAASAQVPAPPGVNILILPGGIVEGCASFVNGNMGGCVVLKAAPPNQELLTYLQMGANGANCTASAPAGQTFFPFCFTNGAVQPDQKRTYKASTQALGGGAAHGAVFSYLFANNGTTYFVASSACNATGLLAGCSTGGNVTVDNEDPVINYSFVGEHFWSANGGRLVTINGHINSTAG